MDSQYQPPVRHKYTTNKNRYNNNNKNYNNYTKKNNDEVKHEQRVSALTNDNNGNNSVECIYQNIECSENISNNKIEMMAMVPTDKTSKNTLNSSQQNHQQQTNKSSSFVPSLSAEHSIVDSTLPSDDSIIMNVNCQDVSSSPSSAASECEGANTNNELIANIESLNINECNRNDCSTVLINQNTYATPQQMHHMPPTLPPHHIYDQQYSCSPYTNELSCNVTSSIYATNGSNPYEYEIHQQYVPQPQQASPYYIYQYSDYAQVAAVNVAQTATAAVVASQQASSQSQKTNANNNSFYTGYQSIPYIYDPNVSLAINTTSQYSQINQPSPQLQQAILSSPQHQSTILASYQTPPQTQHQLYITQGTNATTSSSNMTSPSSISPSDVTPSSNNTINGTPAINDQCNSPQTVNGFIQQIQQTNTSLAPAPPMTTYQTPYTLYYPSGNTNPYLTPHTYQSPMQTTTPGYLMYPPPPIQTNQINQTPQLASPYSIYPNMATPNSINQKNIQTTPNTYKQNRYNNNNRSNRYNKRFQNNSNNKSNVELTPTHSTTFNKLNIASPAIVPSNDDIIQQNIMYHVDENNTPIAIDPNITQHLNVNINNTGSYGQLTPSMCSPATICSPIASTMSQSMCSPNSYDSFYDPGLNHPLYQGFQNFSPNGLPYDYDHSDITTYGDDYDENYDGKSTTDTENEQLACYVCRGRRMCFCYFLKVRYYKFPSFFDLMDHLTKKRRNANIKNKQKLSQMSLN
jgi:hypothetical protein